MTEQPVAPGTHDGAAPAGHAAHGGKASILAALGANLGIALVKFIAFLVSGASAMLAESVHSLADSGNQVLLLWGGRAAKKRPTADHPFGFGRERYISAFVVAIVLFAVGGVFSIYEGVHKIEHPEAITAPLVPIAVLVIAIGLESFSLRTAMREASPVRGRQGWLSFIRRSKAPELPVLLLEDTAALTGLGLALIGVVLAVVTGNGVWDGIGTVSIGALLVGVALLLGWETKSLLVGEGATPETVRALRQAIESGDEVDGVIHMRTLYLGPDELLVAAKVAVRHDDTAADVARAIDAIEARIRAAEPQAGLIYLEPDLRRAPVQG